MWEVYATLTELSPHKGLLLYHCRPEKASVGVQETGAIFVCNAQGHPGGMTSVPLDLISLATHSTNRLLSGTTIVLTETDITQFW